MSDRNEDGMTAEDRADMARGDAVLELMKEGDGAAVQFSRMLTHVMKESLTADQAMAAALMSAAVAGVFAEGMSRRAFTFVATRIFDVVERANEAHKAECPECSAGGSRYGAH